MKRVDGSGHADQRVFTSDYLIPPSKVDKFKDDVHTRPGAKKNKSSHSIPPGHENEWCADTWNAANSISEGTVTVFHQTGGFLCACQHSIIETLAEMRPHRGTTVCRLLPVPGPAQCAEPVGFPGPRESANAIYTGRDCAAKKNCPAIYNT